MQVENGKQSQELDAITMHGLSPLKDTSVNVSALLRKTEFFSLTFSLHVPKGRTSISYILLVLHNCILLVLSAK